MSELHYAIHPGNIIDAKTGKTLNIGSQLLAQLYGLRNGEYIVWNEMLNPSVINEISGDRLIHLYPREDGDYFNVPRTAEDQLSLWVKGKSLHRLSGKEGGSCCPDFSCCIEFDDSTPLMVRKKFIQAREEGDNISVLSFLSMFLTAAVLAETGSVSSLGDQDDKIN